MGRNDGQHQGTQVDMLGGGRKRGHRSAGVSPISESCAALPPESCRRQSITRILQRDLCYAIPSRAPASTFPPCEVMRSRAPATVFASGTRWPIGSEDVGLGFGLQAAVMTATGHDNDPHRDMDGR